MKRVTSGDPTASCAARVASWRCRKPPLAGHFLAAGHDPGKRKRKTRSSTPPAPGCRRCILTYLEFGRPHVESDHIFLRCCAPFRPFAHGGPVSLIVRRAFLRSGIKSPSLGSHILRHSVASEMLRKALPSTASRQYCAIAKSKRQLFTQRSTWIYCGRWHNPGRRCFDDDSSINRSASRGPGAAASILVLWHCHDEQ